MTLPRLFPLLVLLLLGTGCADDPTAGLTADSDGLARLLDQDETTAADHFRILATAAGDSFTVDEPAFITLGYALLEEGRPEAGEIVFRLLTGLEPESWNAWDSLGESRLHLDDRDGAVAAYERSLELNPENRGARSKLESLDLALYEYRHETRERYRYEPGQQTGLKGPYLGQTPPGLEPEVFAPGLISTRGGFEFSCTFSPDGKEFYFNRGFYISVCRLEEDGWTAPARAEFNNESLNHEAHITHDGQRLFWGGRRPQSAGAAADYAIWYLERGDDGWDEPRHHGPGMYVTTAANGDLYLTDIEDVAGGGLAFQSRGDTGYGDLVRLPEQLNDHPAAHPCIDWDSRWLVFDSARPDALGGAGDDDFYVSFRQGETWGAPIHLDAISDPGSNMCASLSPDGKYLFFHGKRDIHWVSAEVLERYRP
ncbi:MAG: hypothetical protein GY838_05260 [bacterium]|nr:hypothetical protein [bacterium]